MTILLVYHSAATGGVGSYLLNLSTRLADRGHRVLAAVPDGELVTRFERLGIACRGVRIKDWRLLRSSRELEAIIRKERVEAVHAHDHSAGAAAWLAARRTATPYLLTIHCRRPLWQRFIVFYWSPRVIAMSRALCDQLVHRMGLPAGRVIETFVGIDVDRFTDAPAESHTLSDLGLVGGETVLVHMSRLSSTKSWVALALVHAAPRLAAACPALVILIAGGGEDEARVRKAADAVNAQLGRAVVRIVGERDDAPELLRTARVVVGTATVVLEAMASGRAVVAAGKFGFVGPVKPDSLTVARATFFGDHGASRGRSPEQLEHAVLVLLQDEALCRTLGQWGRGVVADEFSLARMTDQMEGLYVEMRRRGQAWGVEDAPAESSGMA
jgi:glycosyltransferase involved in cell wall biosynthesis